MPAIFRSHSVPVSLASRFCSLNVFNCLSLYNKLCKPSSLRGYSYWMLFTGKPPLCRLNAQIRVFNLQTSELHKSEKRFSLQFRQTLSNADLFCHLKFIVRISQIKGTSIFGPFCCSLFSLKSLSSKLYIFGARFNFSNLFRLNAKIGLRIGNKSHHRQIDCALTSDRAFSFWQAIGFYATS